MRIPFPERLPLDRVGIFAISLFAIQMIEGTALYFSVGCVAFILIAAFAFNAAGGLTRASGAYIFSYSILVVIIGLCYKAFLGEPAQSNLLTPLRDIELYVASVTAMLLAVIFSRRFARKTGLMQNMLPESMMYRASVGCIVFGVAGGFAIALLGASGASLQSAFGQLNELVPLGIIIGVMYQIRRSGGTRSTNLAILIGIFYSVFLGGIIAFSKQGFLMAPLCWLLPVCALRYRLSLWQILGSVLTLFIFFEYLAPYSQVGRNMVGDNFTMSQRLAVGMDLLEHPQKTRQTYDEVDGEAGYYNKPHGFWDRLQFISVDDGLINFTDQGHVFGLLPIKLGFLNAIPRVFYPDKPYTNFGNLYTHEMGKLNDEDTTTGISYSPTSEAYHLATWTGILVIAPLLWCLFFIVFDSLLGDLRSTPWGLLAFALISHNAPEGGFTGLIYMVTFGVEIIVFCAIFATWVAPIFAIFALGPDRRVSQPHITAPLSPTPPVPR